MTQETLARNKKGRTSLPFLIKLSTNYLDAAGAAAADASAEAFFAFFAFFTFFAFGAEAEADAEAAAGAEAAAEAEGAEVWLAAKEETANRPATRAAIRFFIL